MSINPVTGKHTRGTSNSNERGNSETRRRRRKWLIETYRANVDAPPPEVNEPPRTQEEAEVWFYLADVPLGQGIPACRCYRCGKLLTEETLTVDRIKPGCKGGTYRRDNIRPACAKDNEETGRSLIGHAKRGGVASSSR